MSAEQPPIFNIEKEGKEFSIFGIEELKTEDITKQCLNPDCSLFGLISGKKSHNFIRAHPMEFVPKKIKS